MKKLKNTPISLIATSALLLLLVIFINSAQITFGRYISSFGGELELLFNSKHSTDTVYGDWVATEGRQTLSMNLIKSECNDCIRVRVFIPKTNGLVGVHINIEGQNYIAKIFDVPEGTVVHSLYGDGSICRFYGADGEELFLDFSSSNADNLSATLMLLVRTRIDTSGVKIMVEPVKSKGNGGDRS